MKTPISLGLAIAALLAAGCGDDDSAGKTAATKEKPSPFVGIYTHVVDQKAARKIPDRSMSPDTYRLVIEEDAWQLHAERGPFGGGTLEAADDELRFGPNAESGCDATGVYTAVRSGRTLRLTAKQDSCRSRKALWTLGDWTVAE